MVDPRLALVMWLAVLGGCTSAIPRPVVTGGGGDVEVEPEECTATLRIESLPDRVVDPGSEVAIPFALVTAVRHCERSGSSELVVGEQQGICQRATPGRSVARVSCWWAGRTSEIVLVEVGETLVVRRVETERERVSSEPEELGALGLPENSHLVSLEEAGD